jgi:phosphatidylglycerol---prolipoprotein diacylglyceryl transferase
VIHEGVIIPGCEGEFCTMLENPVFPTPLYEAVICITLFVVLWSMRKSIKIPGVLFGIYLMMNGVERFFIEKIRINSVYHLFGNEITQAEIISTCLFLVGLAGAIFLVKKQKGRSTSV